MGRLRALLAAALATGLLVAVVLITGAGDDADAGEPDAACLRGWNSNPTALALGRHQSTSHRYASAQVIRLDVEGGTLDPDPAGTCAVAWAADVPSRELRASAQVLSEGQWVGLSSITDVTEEQLATLQEEAIAGANAGLNDAGELVPF